jgi:hypothetical protein
MTISLVCFNMLASSLLAVDVSVRRDSSGETEAISKHIRRMRTLDSYFGDADTLRNKLVRACSSVFTYDRVKFMPAEIQ